MLQVQLVPQVKKETKGTLAILDLLVKRVQLVLQDLQEQQETPVTQDRLGQQVLLATLDQWVLQV